MSFQDAKDTFYLTLRDRLAALNPDRTVVVRGGTRPAVIVEENELADVRAESLRNAFVLRWTGFMVDATDAVPLLHGRCEVHYAATGMPEVAGMDRGRDLQAMDEELLAILQPATAPLLGYGGVAASAPARGQTTVFWGDAVFGDTSSAGGPLARVAIVDVFAWKEDL